MPMEKIIEGRTRLAVPDTGKDTGPASKAKIFYNPAMRCNRDITVLFGKAVARDGWTVLDALGGTGAKGIRLANELGPDIHVTVNDLGQEAYGLIRKNIEANKLDNAEASNMEFNALLSSGGFDWIELDPYGSPVRFIDLAVRRLSRGGILSITATDTAPLCGAKPETCRRRYLARPMKIACGHELGLRILVGNAVRRAAVFDFGLEPVLAYYHGHYFRAFFRKKKGARAANARLESLGYVKWDDEAGFSVHSEPPHGNFAGPLWTGPLWDPGTVAGMLKRWDDALGQDSQNLLAALDCELPEPPFHYHTDQMARITHTRPLKTDRLVESLRSGGFSASGVHYDRKGFRTDAGFREIKAAFSEDIG